MEHLEIHPFRRILRGLVVAILSLAGSAYFSLLLWNDLQYTQRETSGTPLAVLVDSNEDVRQKPRASLLWTGIETGSPLFLRDALSVGPAGRATLKFKGKVDIELEPDSLILLNDTQDFTSSFIRGSFVIHSETEDTKVVVAKDGTKKVEKLKVRLLAPAAGAHYFHLVQEEKAATLKWQLKSKPQNGEASLSLEIFQRRNQGTIETHVLALDATEFKFSPPKVGTYFWRLRTGKEIISETRAFSFVPVSKPTIRVNEDGTVSWNLLQPLPNALWAILGGKEKVALNPRSTHFSRRGSYTFQLLIQYEDRTFSSETVQVTEKAPPALELTALHPADNSRMLPSKYLHFVWKKNLPQAVVVLEIEKDGKVIHRQATSASSVLWKNGEVGTFRWRVKEEKAPNESASWSTFKRQAPEPLREPVTVVAPPAPVPKAIPLKPKAKLKAPRELSVEVE